MIAFFQAIPGGLAPALLDRRCPRWFLYHLAELDLYVGVLPFAAFLDLATFAFNRATRPFGSSRVVSVSLVFWLLLVGAAFASSLTEVRSAHGSRTSSIATPSTSSLSADRAARLGSGRVAGSARKTAAGRGRRGLLWSRVAVQGPDRLAGRRAHARALAVGDQRPRAPWWRGHMSSLSSPGDCALARRAVLPRARASAALLAPLLVGLYLRKRGGRRRARWYRGRRERGGIERA